MAGGVSKGDPLIKRAFSGEKLEDDKDILRKFPSWRIAFRSDATMNSLLGYYTQEDFIDPQLGVQVYPTVQIKLEIAQFSDPSLELTDDLDAMEKAEVTKRRAAFKKSAFEEALSFETKQRKEIAMMFLLSALGPSLAKVTQGLATDPKQAYDFIEAKYKSSTAMATPASIQAEIQNWPLKN